MNNSIHITTKYFYLFFLAALFLSATFLNNASAQTPVNTTKSKIDTSSQGRDIVIIHADRYGFKKLSDTLQIKYASGHTVIRQGSTMFYCDSAVVNDRSRVMEAFGHVHINDQDTVNIYSDYLRYQGLDRKAVLKNNVKLSDSKSTLTTTQLDYDLNTRYAVYTQNGRLVSDSTVLTSGAGTYLANTRDATFSKNVVLVDPQYTIKTDSLEYNTYSKVATFVVPTKITSGKNFNMQTSEGYYDLIHKKGYFSKRPIIIDSSSTLIADEVAVDDDSGRGQARGNVVFKDTVQNIVVLCNDLKSNRNRSAFLATLNPVAIIIKDNNDSTFIAADTLYSARFSDSELIQSNRNIQPNQNDTSQNIPKTIYADSANGTSNFITKNSYKKVGDKIVWEVDSSGNIQQNKKIDSIPAKPKKKGIFGIFSNKDNKDTIPQQKNINNSINVDKTTPGIIDSLKNLKSQPIDSAQAKQLKPGVDLSHNNNVDKKDSVNQEDKKSRFLEAYYNVRIYNDSMQAVADSLFYDARDSMFQLYKNPVVWTTSNNQVSQITGDTINLYTANSKPKYIKVWNNAVMINQADTLHNSKTGMYFNQISGRTIEGWFTDGNIDSLSVRGDAHRVYYILGADNKYIGVNTESARRFDFYFKNKELNKSLGRNDIVGKMYPMRQINHESIRLKGFTWQDDKRPKSKYDLLGH